MRMKLNFTINRMLIYDVDITHQMINLKLKIMHSRKHKNPKKKEIWQLKECDAECSICCRDNITTRNWKSFPNVGRYKKSIRRGILDIEKFSVDRSYTTPNADVRSSSYVGIRRHPLHTYLRGIWGMEKEEKMGVKNNDEEEWRKVFEGTVTKRSGRVGNRLGGRMKNLILGLG